MLYTYRIYGISAMQHSHCEQRRVVPWGHKTEKFSLSASRFFLAMAFFVGGGGTKHTRKHFQTHEESLLKSSLLLLQNEMFPTTTVRKKNADDEKHHWPRLVFKLLTLSIFVVFFLTSSPTWWQQNGIPTVETFRKQLHLVLWNSIAHNYISKSSERTNKHFLSSTILAFTQKMQHAAVYIHHHHELH